MSETDRTPNLSRRAVTGLAAGAAALAAAPALANTQPRMQNALAYCEAALSELKSAKSNKGGHRKAAIEHLEYVINQIKQGIVHAS